MLMVFLSCLGLRKRILDLFELELSDTPEMFRVFCPTVRYNIWLLFRAGFVIPYFAGCWWPVFGPGIDKWVQR